MRLSRLLRHLGFAPWRVRRWFPHATLSAIAAAIHAAEQAHGGEIRFAVEGALDLPELWRGLSPRDRAVEVFSHLHVWDPEHNDGVLIYLLLADRRVEIIADRGIDTRAGGEAWSVICRSMENHFAAGDFGRGAVEAIEAVTQLVTQHFPVAPGDRNELPNAPILL